MKRTALLTVALLATLLLRAGAQQGHLNFDVDGFSQHAAHVSKVVLDGPTLQMATSSLPDSNPQAAQLRRLKGVYIYEFKYTSPGQYPNSQVVALAHQLASDGWQIIVQDTSQGSAQSSHSAQTSDAKPSPRSYGSANSEQSWIAVQRNSEMMTALAIVDVKPLDVSIVNIVGPLPNGMASLKMLKDLGKLGSSAGATPKPPPAASH